MKPEFLFLTSSFSLILFFLVACGGEPQRPPAPSETYEVRGLVRQLPDPQKPNTELLLHHEAIPDFKDDRGEVVGMEAMTMPFPVDDPELLEGIAVGDKVTFALEISWGGSPPLRVTQLEKLPEDTELDFKTKPATKRDGH